MSKRSAMTAVLASCVLAMALPAVGFAKEAPWYQEALDYVAAEGMVFQTDADVHPEEPVREMDFLTALYKVSGETGGQQACLNWAQANGLTAHVTWDDGLTREEMLEMVHQGLKANGQAASGVGVDLPYTDKAQLAAWAVEAATDCTVQQIIVGQPEGILAPKALTTQAEVWAVLERFDRRLKADGAKLEALFDRAVQDAKIIMPEEIFPVTAITKDSPLVTWNEAGDRVLLLTFHKYPDSYQEGQTATTKWGEVWTFTDREMVDWYAKNGAEVSDWPLRLRQLIGLRPDNSYTHISALWVKPEDMVRPAYETDITTGQMTDHFAEAADADFRAWFEANAASSYDSDTPYPWTRLGYTYDWADNGQAFGLSEFLIQKDATVEVEFTKTIADFVQWLEEEAAAEKTAEAA